jgi:hypothetical protein
VAHLPEQRQVNQPPEILSTERGIINGLLKMPKISGVHQSAFDGQSFVGRSFFTTTFKNLIKHLQFLNQI